MTQPAISPQLAEVIDYLRQHPDQQPDFRELAQRAGLSPYYFHRQFSQQFGLSLGALQRLVRLQKAAWQLAFRPKMRVLDIALEAGFSSGESFARTFKRYARQTPLEFREAPDWPYWETLVAPIQRLVSFDQAETSGEDGVEEVIFPALPVALLVHRGPPSELMQSIQTFIQWRRTHGVSPPDSRTFNLLYADPATTIPEHWTFGLAAGTRRPVKDNAQGVQACQIPQMTCLSGEFVGDDSALFRHLHHQVSRHDHRLDLQQFPLFIERLSWFPDVPAHEARSRWYAPIKD